MKFSSTTRYGDLANVEGVEFGGHARLNKPPFHLVASGKDGREGEDEDILHRIFYRGVSTFVDVLNEAHTILQTCKVMIDGQAFGLVGEFLDGSEDSRRGFGGILFV
jgi:hypothetical protein